MPPVLSALSVLPCLYYLYYLNGWGVACGPLLDLVALYMVACHSMPVLTVLSVLIVSIICTTCKY